MKKVLLVLALVVAYGVSVSTASAKMVFVDDVKTTVADKSDDKKVEKEKEAKATKAKADGCSGEAKAAKADGCAGEAKTAKAEGCSGKEKTASAGGCEGKKVAEK